MPAASRATTTSTAAHATTATTPASVAIAATESIDIQAPHTLHDQPTTSASCPTTTRCYVLAQSGRIAWSDDPTAATPTWTSTPTPITGYSGLSCPSTDLCVAARGSGLWRSTTPTVGSSWHQVATGSALNEVSCPSTAICLADGVATSHPLISTDPGDAAPTWSPLVSPLPAVTGGSCASTTSCVLVGRHLVAGATTYTPAIAATSDPTDPDPSWTVTELGTEAFGTSCPTSDLCVTSQGSSHVAWSSDPFAASPTYTVSAVPPPKTVASVPNVVCQSDGSCVELDGGSLVATSDVRTGTWGTERAIGATPQDEDLSCLPGLCLTSTATGYALTVADPVAGTVISSDALGDSTIRTVSCPTASFCALGDDAGRLMTSATPDVASSWSGGVQAVGAISTLACPSASECVATSGTLTGPETGDDDLLVTTDAGADWTTTKIGSTSFTVSTSCPSVRECVYLAGDGSVGLVDPTAPAGAKDLGGAYQFDDQVTCRTTTVCWVIDDAHSGSGNAGEVEEFDPTHATFDQGQTVFGGGYVETAATVSSVSCPTIALCVAVDGTSTAYASTQPAENGSFRGVAALPMTTVSCLSSTRLCVGAGPTGVAATSDPLGAAGTWSSIAVSLPVVTHQGYYENDTAPIGVAVASPTRTYVDDGSSLLAVTTAVGVPGPATSIAVVASDYGVYSADGMPTGTGFTWLSDLVPSPSSTNDPQDFESSAPAVAAVPTSGGWPAAAVVLKPGVYADSHENVGAYVHLLDHGWIPVAGGGCLGIGAAATATTLYVGCEGTDHGWYTATAPLPLSTSTRLSAWVHRPGTLEGSPALAVIGGQVHVAVIGVRGVLYTQVLGQAGFAQLPASCATAPGLAGFGSSGVLACRAGSGPLLASTYSGGHFGGFANLGGTVVGQPGVALGASGPTFAVAGTNHRVYVRTPSTPWTSRPGTDALGHQLDPVGGAAIVQTSP